MLCYVTALNKSRSQSQDEFQTFSEGLERFKHSLGSQRETWKIPFKTIYVLDNFNTKSYDSNMAKEALNV